MKTSKTFIALFALLSCALVGCNSSESSVTKQEEDAFRAPVKDIPPDVLKQMQKSREEGIHKAEEMRNKSNTP